MRIKLLLLLSFLSILSAEAPKQYLKGRISTDNKRYSTFYKAIELLQERNAKILLETGTSRGGVRNFAGDGGSTIIFSHFAKDQKAHFFSIDLSREYLKEARDGVEQAVGLASSYLHFITSDSVQFLSRFHKRIDFLYLDSYDFEEDNPLPSQMHHLREIEAAYPLLHEKSIILIDDCDLPGGGKGKLAIDFLLQKGWKVLLSEYQVLLLFPGEDDGDLFL